MLKLGAEDEVDEGGLDINLRHICEIDVLDTAAQRGLWTVNLMD